MVKVLNTQGRVIFAGLDLASGENEVTDEQWGAIKDMSPSSQEYIKFMCDSGWLCVEEQKEETKASPEPKAEEKVEDAPKQRRSRRKKSK